MAVSLASKVGFSMGVLKAAGNQGCKGVCVSLLPCLKWDYGLLLGCAQLAHLTKGSTNELRACVTIRNGSDRFCFAADAVSLKSMCQK